MSDITIAELASALPAGDAVRTWWEAASALPANVDPAEFFIRTLNGAHLAATTKNQPLQAGSQIASYPAPVNSAVTIDTTTGTQSFVTTYSVQARVSVDLDIAVATVQ